jgi:hypothetical protein
VNANAEMLALGRAGALQMELVACGVLSVGVLGITEPEAGMELPARAKEPRPEGGHEGGCDWCRCGRALLLEIAALMGVEGGGGGLHATAVEHGAALGSGACRSPFAQAMASQAIPLEEERSEAATEVDELSEGGTEVDEHVFAWQAIGAYGGASEEARSSEGSQESTYSKASWVWKEDGSDWEEGGPKRTIIEAELGAAMAEAKRRCEEALRRVAEPVREVMVVEASAPLAYTNHLGVDAVCGGSGPVRVTGSPGGPMFTQVTLESCWAAAGSGGTEAAQGGEEATTSSVGGAEPCGGEGGGRSAVPRAVQPVRRLGLQVALQSFPTANAGQQHVLARYFRADANEQVKMVVLGMPGAGKSRTLLAMAAGQLAETAKGVVTIAEYNHQVKKLAADLAAAGLPIGCQTRAGLYQIDNDGCANPDRMLAQMKEEPLERLKAAHLRLEDEFALASPFRIDACAAVDSMLGKATMNVVRFGDPNQGNPIVSTDELETIPQYGGAPRRHLSTDGDWFALEEVEVLTLTESERSRGETDLIGCLRELSGGPACVGPYCDRVRQVASAKVFADDLYVPLGLGSNKQVMDRSNAKSLRRAARRGATEANGGVAVHWDAEATRAYTAKELKCIRSIGFEWMVFVIGEKVLIAVKEADPNAVTPDLRVDSKYVTNMTEATVTGFGYEGTVLETVFVRIEEAGMSGRPTPVQRMRVDRVSPETGRQVVAWVFPLKPFYERYIKLFQGLEFDEFELDTSHFMGDGLLLMGLSRVRRLSGLKLTGVYSMKQMAYKAKLDWKVVDFMSKFFDVPAKGREWAKGCREAWEKAWREHDRSR